MFFDDPGSDVAINLEKFHYALASQIKLEKFSITRGRRPKTKTPQWELDDWNNEEILWAFFDDLVARLKQDTTEPLCQIIIPGRDYFHLHYSWYERYREDFKKFTSANAQKHVFRVEPGPWGAPTFVEVSFSRTSPVIDVIYHEGYGNPKTYVHEEPTLVNRRRYFLLKAFVSILPLQGTLFLSSYQVKDFLEYGNISIDSETISPATGFAKIGFKIR